VVNGDHMNSIMKQEAVRVGENQLHAELQLVRGNIVELNGEQYYRIENYDSMSPLFMNIVSDSDLWMFISSTGALTAGRRNPDNALFPYYNDDRIHDSHDITGSKTILHVCLNDKKYVWEPFSTQYEGIYKVNRNIYKKPIGNDIIFEEVNHDLKLTFRYTWTSCDRFGFVRKSSIINDQSFPVTVSMLDGILNILPAGVDRHAQLAYSTLLDGYKKNELLPENGIGLYTLSSLLSDKAEPAESLRATMVWSAGLDSPSVLLSSLQVDGFRRGIQIETEKDIRAQRGAYLLNEEFILKPKSKKEWFIIAELKADQSHVESIRNLLENDSSLPETINKELIKSTENLKRIVAKGDAHQLSQDPLTTSRHYSVSMFNIMRGGIFENDYNLSREDLITFIRKSNLPLYNKYSNKLTHLPETVRLKVLRDQLNINDPDLERLLYEYLPLSFSRRHGDPSRPWNDFSIDLKDEQGNKTLNYQGNWRDVFQNWEALALSFPEFIENMISKFVNSSTPDGYNPYRLMLNGFEWEAPDPDAPFANIGYWGDHQIVYLLKLLKLSAKYHPGKLQDLLSENIFSYANIPYRIKPYGDILKDPHHTIDFDQELHDKIKNNMKKIGTDAQRVLDVSGNIFSVNLAEKILLPALVKLSNFIPGAGIWMNTQRPEWNDANNALVGYGVSMVTLYYLRDYIHFLKNVFESLKAEHVQLSDESHQLLSGIFESLNKYRDLLKTDINDNDRKKVLDDLGENGSKHRLNIYHNGFNGNRKDISKQEILDFCNLSLTYIDHSIDSNKRNDGLYHAYNVINIDEKEGVSIRRLSEMLEGQVALLSSGILTPEDSIDVLNSLRASALYREDQRSYILYPDKQLPRFMEKNIISDKNLKRSTFLQDQLKNKDLRIINRDIAGHIHFNAQFKNAGVLKEALEALKNEQSDLDHNEISEVLDIYESVFDHRSFTGRSGTFYKYEGLGCIYWHMVSKLLLAVKDTFYRAIDEGADPEILKTLKKHYYEIREGIGSHKNPEEYGSFPMDPYSHTPGYSGVQQPGMTGQTKEDMLARAGELGLRINNGKISFSPLLLNENEFLERSKMFTYYDISGKEQSLMLSTGMLALTLCQVPVIYINSDENKIIVTRRDGSEEILDGPNLPKDLSASIFQRDDTILKLHVLRNTFKG